MNIPKSFIDSDGSYHALNNIELQQFLDMNNIKGSVIMREETPHPKATIINLDDIDNQGTHWTALYNRGDKSYYFDSFGVQLPEEILKALKAKGQRIFYSTNTIQPLKSILCGYYCCVFLYWLSKGKEAYDFLYQFGLDNEGSNDKLLKQIIEKGNKIESKNDISETSGKGFDLVEKAGELFENQEWHLFGVVRDENDDLTVKKHNWTGPFSDNEKKISNWEELRETPWADLKMGDVALSDEKFKGINSIDKNAMMHDIAYDLIHRQYSKDDQLDQIHKADRILQDASIRIMKDSKESMFTRVEGAFVGLVMTLKIKTGLGTGTDPETKRLLKFIKLHQNKLSEASQSALASLLTQD